MSTYSELVARLLSFPGERKSLFPLTNVLLKFDPEPELMAWLRMNAEVRREAAAAIERLTKERDDAERRHQDFRLQNDREWKAKVDHQKAELAKAREALVRVVFEEHAPGFLAASMPHDMREQCRAALAGEKP